MKDAQILRMIDALRKESAAIAVQMPRHANTTDLRAASLVINAMVTALYAALSDPRT